MLTNPVHHYKRFVYDWVESMFRMWFGSMKNVTELCNNCFVDLSPYPIVFHLSFTYRYMLHLYSSSWQQNEAKCFNKLCT